MEARAECLGRVFDDCDPVLARERLEPVHGADAAVQMDRDDRSRPFADCLSEGFDVHVVVLSDTHQDRRGTRVDDRGHGCDERVANGDHLMPGTHAKRQQREMQRVVSAGNPNRILRADVLS